MDDVSTIDIREFINKKATDIKAFISNSITNNAELITRRIDDDSYSYYLDKVYGITKHRNEAEKELDRMDRFFESLNNTVSYLKIIDSLYDSTVNIEINDLDEKTDFILSKLNDLFGDEFFSIETILDLNDLPFRQDESKEIASNLSKRGYVILQNSNFYNSTDFCKISVKGSLYISRKVKQKQKTYTKTQLDKRLDNIVEHLEKIGLGQEVIFDEIEELRKLQHKLSKKSWSQLLKGKLVDLALNKIINIETVSSIYTYLTNNDFKMLK